MRYASSSFPLSFLLLLVTEGGKWLREHSMACYISHLYIILSPKTLAFPFLLFLFPPSFLLLLLFLGVTWEVLACISLTWWKLSTKSLVVRFRMATASHFQALDILYLLWAKHFKYAKKRSCGVSLRGAYTHNSRHFLTKRPITQSILRVSGSMASH